MSNPMNYFIMIEMMYPFLLHKGQGQGKQVQRFISWLEIDVRNDIDGNISVQTSDTNLKNQLASWQERNVNCDAEW